MIFTTSLFNSSILTAKPSLYLLGIILVDVFPKPYFLEYSLVVPFIGNGGVEFVVDERIVDIVKSNVAMF